MLYRLDYEASGKAVRDPVVGGDLITRHMATARRKALAIARWDREAILISRIGKAGAIKPSLVIDPDGRARRPATTQPASDREDCHRHVRQPCFCTACRAERREQRR